MHVDSLDLFNRYSRRKSTSSRFFFGPNTDEVLAAFEEHVSISAQPAKITTMNNPKDSVVVIIGADGMGQAIDSDIARKGGRLLYADVSKKILDEAIQLAHQVGLLAEGRFADVSDRNSLEALAHAARAIGRIRAVILTAGLLSVSATAKAIMDVNLVGAANVIDILAAYAGEGTSMVCIASMGGYKANISKDLECHLATAETGRLLDHPDLDLSTVTSRTAYTVSKRANHRRVQVSAHLCVSKGARMNSISPVVISTAAGNAEIEAGPEVKRLIKLSAMGRLGLPIEVPKVVTFRTGPKASFITGSNILVDGGAAPGLRWNNFR